MCTARRAAGLLVAVIIATTGVLAATQPVSALANSSDEQALFHSINAARAQAGLGPLLWDEGLANIAREWAANLTSIQSLVHNPDKASQVSNCGADWRNIGENLDDGATAEEVAAAFLGSPVHFDNIVKTYFNRVGIGVVPDGNGKLWVVELFVNSPNGCGSSPAPTSPPPTSPSPSPTPPPATTAPPPPPPANVPPVAPDDTARVQANSTGTAIDVLANDSDPDNNLDPTTLVVLNGPTAGTAVVTDAHIAYTPATGYVGSDSLTYQVCDTEGACAQGHVSVTVEKPQPPPAIDIPRAVMSPGSTLDVPGDTCVPGQVVTFSVNDAVAGSTTAGADGRFQGPVKLPDHVGQFTVRATCGDAFVDRRVDVVLSTSGGGTLSGGLASIGALFAFFVLLLILLRQSSASRAPTTAPRERRTFPQDP